MAIHLCEGALLLLLLCLPASGVRMDSRTPGAPPSSQLTLPCTECTGARIERNGGDAPRSIRSRALSRPAEVRNPGIPKLEEGRLRCVITCMRPHADLFPAWLA
jgi:hypothetical protein